MWNNILYSGNDFSDDEKFLKFQFKLMNSILLLAIIGSILIAIILFLVDQSDIKILAITMELLYGFINLGLFLFLRQNKNNIQRTIHIGIICLYILQVVMMINQVDDSLREAWFFLTIIISYILAGRRFGFIMLIIIFFTMLIYNFQPFIETNLSTPESVMPMILLIIIALLMNLSETIKENYEHSLEQSNLSLQHKIEELKNFNANLENRVQEEIKINGQHEFKIFEQSKMAAMGEMIGNIAHQWRQPLSAILTSSTGMQIQKELGSLDDEIFNNTCEDINKNVHYLSQTIDDFRNFIKGDRIEQSFNLSTIMDSFLHLVEASITNHYIDLKLDLNDKIELLGYPNELVQCFMNIFNNSKDALKEFQEDNRFLSIKTQVENHNVIITFTDNAGGIPDDVLPKIFDPYFTTKHQAQGTGLGLNMTYKLIVIGMKGNLEAKNISVEHNNTRYRGAQFTITLPISNLIKKEAL